MYSKPQAAVIGLPTLTGITLPWGKVGVEHAAPELQGALRIIGWEFDQRGGHVR
jgi:hypothetical protein